MSLANRIDMLVGATGSPRILSIECCSHSTERRPPIAFGDTRSSNIGWSPPAIRTSDSGISVHGGLCCQVVTSKISRSPPNCHAPQRILQMARVLIT